MIKILYEAGHRPHVRKLLITVSSDFFKCAIGPSNSLLFSTQSSCIGVHFQQRLGLTLALGQADLVV